MGHEYVATNPRADLVLRSDDLIFLLTPTWKEGRIKCDSAPRMSSALAERGRTHDQGTKSAAATPSSAAVRWRKAREAVGVPLPQIPTAGEGASSDNAPGHGLQLNSLGSVGLAVMAQQRIHRHVIGRQRLR